MQKLVIANWKMNASLSWLSTLVQPIAQHQCSSEVVLCPPYPYLAAVRAALEGSQVALGAQDVSQKTHGAYTGQVSATMLSELGCQYVIVGHSERRQYNHETPEEVAEKFQVAKDAGLRPVLCLGETLAEREARQTESVLLKQLEPFMKTPALLEAAVIAYEPVWAIGTGMTATPEQAQAVHAFLREKIPVKSLRILYGGSVKGDNASALFAMPDIDGALVGGASLKASTFIEICDLAN